MIAGMRLAQKIAGTDPLKPKIIKALKPGDDLETDEDYHDHLRSRVELIYHPVGTCRIGKDDDAVVDPELRVHGLEGLRVCRRVGLPRDPGRQHERARDRGRRARRRPDQEPRPHRLRKPTPTGRLSPSATAAPWSWPGARTATAARCALLLAGAGARDAAATFGSLRAGSSCGRGNIRGNIQIAQFVHFVQTADIWTL